MYLFSGWAELARTLPINGNVGASDVAVTKRYKFWFLSLTMLVSSLTWGPQKVTIPNEHKAGLFSLSEIAAWILQLIACNCNIGVVPLIFSKTVHLSNRNTAIPWWFLLISNQPGGWQKLNKETAAPARLDRVCMGNKT